MRFEPKNIKKWIFWVFRSALKRFGIFSHDSDHSQAHRKAAQLHAQGGTTLKTATLLRKICVFSQKKPQKNRLSGVYRAAVKHFAIVLYESDDAQIYRMAFQLDAQGDPTLKTATLFKIKCVLSRNISKKIGFYGLFKSSIKRFGFLFYDSDDAQTHHLAAHSGAAALKKTIL